MTGNEDKDKNEGIVTVRVLRSTPAAVLVCREEIVLDAGGIDAVPEDSPRAWIPKKHLGLGLQELSPSDVVRGVRGFLYAAYLKEEENKFIEHSKKHAASRNTNAELIDITSAINVDHSTEFAYGIECMGLLEDEDSLHTLINYPQIALIPKNLCRPGIGKGKGKGNGNGEGEGEGKNSHSLNVVMAPLWSLTSSVERIHLRARADGINNLVQINIAGLAFPVNNPAPASTSTIDTDTNETDTNEESEDA